MDGAVRSCLLEVRGRERGERRGRRSKVHVAVPRWKGIPRRTGEGTSSMMSLKDLSCSSISLVAWYFSIGNLCPSGKITSAQSA